MTPPLGGLFPESFKLVLQDLKDQPRVEFRVVHMPRLQPPIVVMLDEMMMGVARKGQRVQPQRVDRRPHLLAQARAGGEKVLNVVSQNVVAEDEGDIVQRRFQKIERSRGSALRRHHRRPIMPNRCKIENCGRLRIDFEIDGEATLQEGGLVFESGAKEAE